MMAKRIPLEEYNKLYYCITEREYKYHKATGIPYWRSAKRRYTTLVDARKAALAKSNKILIDNVYAPLALRDSATVYVFKGNDFLGYVTTAKMFPGYTMAGVWNAKGSIKDDQPMKRDGTLGRK